MPSNVSRCCANLLSEFSEAACAFARASCASLSHRYFAVVKIEHELSKQRAARPWPPIFDSVLILPGVVRRPAVPASPRHRGRGRRRRARPPIVSLDDRAPRGRPAALSATSRSLTCAPGLTPSSRRPTEKTQHQLVAPQECSPHQQWPGSSCPVLWLLTGKWPRACPRAASQGRHVGPSFVGVHGALLEHPALSRPVAACRGSRHPQLLRGLGRVERLGGLANAFGRLRTPRVTASGPRPRGTVPAFTRS